MPYGTFARWQFFKRKVDLETEKLEREKMIRSDEFNKIGDFDLPKRRPQNRETVQKRKFFVIFRDIVPSCFFERTFLTLSSIFIQ